MSVQYSLYYFDACPFCQLVLRSLPSVKVEIELRNTINDPKHRNDLIAGGGRSMVPCLRIDKGEDTQWLYESMDIIKFLKSL